MEPLRRHLRRRAHPDVRQRHARQRGLRRLSRLRAHSTADRAGRAVHPPPGALAAGQGPETGKAMMLYHQPQVLVIRIRSVIQTFDFFARRANYHNLRFARKEPRMTQPSLRPEPKKIGPRIRADQRGELSIGLVSF